MANLSLARLLSEKNKTEKPSTSLGGKGDLVFFGFRNLWGGCRGIRGTGTRLSSPIVYS